MPKGAIVFNHKQTEQLLKYGHINSRGQALASGNAFAGDVTVSTSSGFKLPSSPKSAKPTKTDKVVENSVKDAAKDVSDAASSVADESSKTADWVEKVLENLEKKADKYISRAEKKAENGNFAGAAKQYRKAEQVYANAMSKQKDAESIYAAQAAKVLKDAVAQGKITDSQSKDIERKVANGAMELSKLSEGTEKIVSEYEEYYDKAIAAADATAEIYDKYEEVAKSLYQLPLDQVEANTKQLDNEMDLLEKRLELTNDSTKKTALMEEQMANARAKHAAQIDSYDKAYNNYITALRKVNESSDKALKGLTESQKQMITELVAAGEKIDYSSIVGASDEAKRAIIDYNASLEVQRQALYDVQMSSMETTLSLRELAAAIANQPIEDANEEIDKRQRPREVRNAQYDVAQTAEQQNKILAQDIAGAKRDEKSREDALNRVEDELDKAWNDGALVALRNTAAGAGKKFGEKITENEVAAAIQELSKTGKLRDANGNVVKKGSAEYQNAYDQMLGSARAYNAGLRARNTAQYDYDEQVAKTQKLIWDNNYQKIQNIADKWNRKIASEQSKVDSGTAGLDQIGGTLNAYQYASPEKKQQLLQQFAKAYGFELDPSQDYYANYARGQEYIAEHQGNVAQLNEKAAVAIDTAMKNAELSAEQGAEAEAQILAFRQAGEQAEADKRDTQKKRDDTLQSGSEDGYQYRANEKAYNDQKQANANKTAEGGLLTRDDYAATVDAGTAYRASLETRLAELQNELDTYVEGTDAWDECNQKVQDTASSLSQLIGEINDAKTAMHGEDEQELLDALANTEHKGALIDARDRKTAAIASAIGGALGGSSGAGFGEAIQAVMTMVGVGGAALTGIAGAIQSGNTDLGSILGAAGSAATTFYQDNTKEGNLEAKGQNYADLQAYYQSVIDNKDGEYSEQEVADATDKLADVEEQIANNEADQAEERAKQAGGGGGSGGGAEDAAKKLHELISNLIHYVTHAMERHLGKIEYRLKLITNAMAETEARGRRTTPDQLIDQISTTKEEIEFYQNEYIPQLQREVAWTDDENGDPSGAERTQDQMKVYQAKTELSDLKLELIRLERLDLRDKLMEPLSEAHEHLERMYSILEGISSLITDDMLFDIDGNITQNGTDRLTLLLGQYQAAEAEIQHCMDDINALNAMRANYYNTSLELEKELSEAQKKLLDAEKDREQQALAYMDILQEQSQQELDQLSEIIDARKEALQAKKDYYDYDKTIRNKTKDIQTLQAQIAALNGLTDAESKAKKAQLEADLKDAQDELKDTVQEHEFGLASDALDKLRDVLEEANEDHWKEVTGDLKTLLTYVGDISASTDTSQIADAMSRVLKDLGIETGYRDGKELDEAQFFGIFMPEMQKLLNDRYSDDNLQSFYQEASDTTQRMIDEKIWSKAVAWQTPVDKLTGALAAINQTSDLNQDEIADASSNWSRIKQALQKLGLILGLLFSLPELVLQPFVGWDGPSDKLDAKLGGYADFLESPMWNFSRAIKAWTSSYSDANSNDGYGIIGSGIQASKETSSLWQQVGEDIKNGWDKLVNGIKGLFGGHASGSKRIKRNEWAWTQEGRKEEWIVRQSDGAILTPLSKGDGVLPANLTSRLWDLATGNLPSFQPTMPSFSIPDMNISENFSPHVTQTFGSLLTVNGNVDATVVDDLKQFTKDLASNKELLESAYKYTSEQMYRGFLHSGGKRRT